jgi:type VI secretion system protein ImpL
MSGFSRFLRSRSAFALLGVLALSLLVWLVGPLVAIAGVAPLEGEIARLVTIVLLLLAWVAGFLYLRMRAKSAEKGLVDGVTGGDAAGSAAEEIAVLRERMDEAVALLRKSSKAADRGQRFLYELPWYMLIGPPGSGKSTALAATGLVRRAAGQGRRQGVRGIGGTRNCEWIFTDDAIILDTAGRYTTQDSHGEADARAWTGFLVLLRRTRPRQPINGAIVAISLADVAFDRSGLTSEHARAVRARVDELAEVFGTRFPIYVMFTKADLIAGFTEFFGDLTREEREQVWGMTFPPDPGDGFDAASAFVEGFDALVARAASITARRLQEAPDLDQRTGAFGFVSRFAAVREPVAAFLEEAFGHSRYDRQPMLRGVYFTSGTQEGVPIDRLAVGLAESFGLSTPSGGPTSGGARAYFMTRLFRDLVFPEAHLVGANAALERRLRLTKVLAMAGAAAALVLGAGAWTASYFANVDLLARTEADLAEFERLEKERPVDPVQLVQFGYPEAVLGPLNALEATLSRLDGPTPLLAGLGLDQREKVRAQVADHYETTLNFILLPRLARQVEEVMARNLANSEILYDGLKTYLMLGGQGPMDRDHVQAWFAAHWARALPDPAAAPRREALARHLGQLLQAPLRPPPLNTEAIARHQATLQRDSTASRVYAAIRNGEAARTLPPWRLTDAGGPNVGRVFARASGRALTDGIPGLFTKTGFYNAFLPRLPLALRAASADAWVVGGPPQGLGTEDLARLDREVIDLYIGDYVTTWERLLADLAVLPSTGFAQAAQLLGDLAGGASPFRRILTAVADQTKLTAPPAGLTLPALPPAVGAVVGAVAGRAPGQDVEDRFSRLHAYIEGRSTAPGETLDESLRLLNDLYAQIARLAPNAGAADIVQPGSPIQQLNATLPRLPPAVAGTLGGLTRNLASLASGGAREQVRAIWTSTVLPLCLRATERYPFTRSADEVPLLDFANLFRPGGLIDDFFVRHLRPNVDVNQPVWRAIEGAVLPVPTPVLVQFQRAAAIRDAFFPIGAAPAVRFDLIPQRIDARVTALTVEIDGQVLAIDPRNPRGMPFTWPSTGVGTARIGVEPEIAGQASALVIDGPWALFRLLDRSNLTPTTARERIQFSVPVGGRTIGLEIRAGSVSHPFGLRDLGEFRCPSTI